MVAHTGIEPVISALRGRRPWPLDECALPELHHNPADPICQVRFWQYQSSQPSPLFPFATLHAIAIANAPSDSLFA
jgi:hypothetical protein